MAKKARHKGWFSNIKIEGPLRILLPSEPGGPRFLALLEEPPGDALQMELILDAHDIAEKARLLLAGVYVHNDGHGGDEQHLRLPWSSKFVGGTDKTVISVPLDEDVATLYDWVFNKMEERTLYSQGPRILCGLPFFNEEHAVRAAAAEALVSADWTISHLLNDELPEALINLSCAYQCLAEGQARARAILASRLH